jgi:hypothetical protein
MKFALIAIAIAAIFYLSIRAMSHRKRQQSAPPKSRIEIWVYIRDDARPDDAAIRRRTVNENPHVPRGRQAVGASEWATMRDVRFHLGEVQRTQNAFVFRPEAICMPDANVPEDIARLTGAAKTRVMVVFSDEQGAAKSHLQMAWHVVDAIAALGNGTLIFDVEAQRFWLPEELSSALDENPDATRFDLNTNVVAADYVEGDDTALLVHSRGLNKLGLTDVEMDGVPLDHRTIANFIVEEVAQRLWEGGEQAHFEFEGFGEQFVADLDTPRSDAHFSRGWVSSIRARRKHPV